MKSDITISCSGIAGPSGGTPYKPIGLVYIGIYYKHLKKIIIGKFIYDFERIPFRDAVAYTIFLSITQYLVNNTWNNSHLKKFFTVHKQ